MLFLGADRLSAGSPRETNSDAEFYRNGEPASKQKSSEGSEAPSPLSREVCVTFALGQSRRSRISTGRKDN